MRFRSRVQGTCEDERFKFIPPAGTLGYLASSYLQPSNLSMKSDVFSFGILLLENISGGNAIDVDYSPSSIADWAIPLIKKCDLAAIRDRRMGPPANASVARKLALPASHCAAVDATRRPVMPEVVQLLEEVRKMRVGAWNVNFRLAGRSCVLA